MGQEDAEVDGDCGGPRASSPTACTDSGWSATERLNKFSHGRFAWSLWDLRPATTLGTCSTWQTTRPPRTPPRRRRPTMPETTATTEPPPASIGGLGCRPGEARSRRADRRRRGRRCRRAGENVTTAIRADLKEFRAATDTRLVEDNARFALNAQSLGRFNSGRRTATPLDDWDRSCLNVYAVAVRKRDGLVPIEEAMLLAGMRLREASPQALHSFD